MVEKPNPNDLAETAYLAFCRRSLKPGQRMIKFEALTHRQQESWRRAGIAVWQLLNTYQEESA